MRATFHDWSTGETNELCGDAVQNRRPLPPIIQFEGVAWHLYAPKGVT
jgi:hypothetical protein